MADEKAPSPVRVSDRGAGGQDPLIGQVLGERYRVEKRLNHGAMGVVYRARHVMLDSQLAVKVLLKPQNQEDQKRFLQEAQLASTVSHPNTVQIVDFGVLPGGQSYLVMELMRGRTLAAEVEKGPMEALRVCHIGAQIARALQAVHDQGIIHRDMKPENVFLLERDGSADFVKIVDFGIATSVSAAGSPIAQVQQSDDALQQVSRRELVKTKDGNTLGTPPYMAPEQCISKNLDGRCDQYALGCILYEMLTGKFVFDEKSVVKYMTAHVKTVPVPPRQRVPERDIPESIEIVVMRMLEKMPEARFGSMKEVAEALTQAADSVVSARSEKPLPAVENTAPIAPRRRSRQRVIRAVLAGLIVLALGSAGYVGYRIKKNGQGTEDKSTVELWQLQAVRAGALESLRQAAQPGGSTGTDTDRALRHEAISALGETRDAELRPELEALLTDPDETVQIEAAAALGRLGDRAALPALQAARERSKSGLLRLTVARAMLDLGDGEGEKILSVALGAGAPEERLRAASLLCDRRNADADKLLLLSVDAGKFASDAATLEALGCLLKSESVEAARTRLQRRLADAPNAERRIEIAQVLSRAGDVEGRRALRELTGKPGPMQLTAARALSAPDVPEVAELFRRVLRDPKARHAARRLAIEGLGYSGQIADALLAGQLLGSAAPDLRAAAAATVLRLSVADPTALGQESLRWARASLGDPSWQRRESAALILGDSAVSDAVELLARLLKDADARVRHGAARALGRRLDEPALLALREGLRDSDAAVRLETLRSIGRVGQALLKAGVIEVHGQVSGWFGAILASGLPREQILVHTILFELGDSSQAAAFVRWKDSKDPSVRRFLLEESAVAAELAPDLLKDSDPGVRFAAAHELAESGDARGVDVLKSTLARGGPDGVAAYGLLIRLGQPVSEPATVQAGFEAARTEAERMAAVEAMAHLPAALAMPLLLKAARDPEPLVRRLSAEVAADLPASQRALAPGFPVLRLLLADREPAVKNLAAALLGRIGTKDAPSPPSEPGTPEKTATPRRFRHRPSPP